MPRIIYRVVPGLEIWPYNTEEKQMGMAWETSTSYEIPPEDILEELALTLPNETEETAIFRLSLGENPSPYDCYLIRKKDVIQP